MFKAKSTFKKWADDYYAYLEYNTKDVGNMAINTLGLVGGSFVIDSPITSYTPPTTGTSEAQLLVIRGLLRNYMASKEAKWLNKARFLMDALLNYYYPTPVIPSEPDGSWVPHWLVNVTAPFISREYAVDGVATFVNGVATVTYEKVFRIYSVRATDATLEYTWSPAAPVVGTEYEIDHTDVNYGNSEATIYLKTNYTGDALVVYSSETGRVVNVGEKCEAFPVWRPLDPGEIACAVDALAWALDVFQMWYDIEGDEKWLRAVESTKVSVQVVSGVSNAWFYVKPGKVGEEVLKDGVTRYSVRTPSETYINSGGLIIINYAESAGDDEALFGTWVGTRIDLNEDQWIELKLGSDKIQKVRLSIDEDAGYDPDKRWVTEFWTPGRGITNTDSIQFHKDDFYKADGIFWGSHYDQTSNGGAIASANSSVEFTDVLDEIDTKTIRVTDIKLTRGDEGGWYGWSQFMFSIWSRKLPFSIRYKTDSAVNFLINDADGVRWTCELPGTSGEYVTVNLTESMFTGGTAFAAGDYQSMLLDAVDVVTEISVEYVGTKVLMNKEYYSAISFGYSKQAALQIGLEYIRPVPPRVPMPYVPYILPFDMHYINYALSDLRGAVYTGYQAPWIYQRGIYANKNVPVDTNLQFLRDSQTAYEESTGTKGFFAPIFWWDYRDDHKDHEPNTFGWDTQPTWGGFQYRTISDVARVLDTDPSNRRAYTIFIDFVTAVDKLWGDTYNSFPTAFEKDKAPYHDQRDPHMITNFMRSLIYGMKSTYLSTTHKRLIGRLLDRCTDYLQHFRVPVVDFSSEVEGTWSPDPANKTWYGYWGGDILDTLGLMQLTDFSDSLSPAYTEYLDLVTSQHRVQVNFMAWLERSLTLLDDCKAASEDISFAFDLDNAAGVQLDIIGEQVGRSRALGFQLSTGSSRLDDEDYRSILKAKIAQNSWNGTIPQIYQIWDTLFPDIPLQIIDNQNMTMDVIVSGSFGPVLTELVTAGLIVPKPMGVGVTITGSTSIERSDYIAAVIGGYDIQSITTVNPT
ncbi:DUF2612 domain-containing protein [Paenibacillus ginsengarvi]|uniref:DUF2612 domain-containing protein n=1 Tax=Paenibacillus ginsengarvi TaxID=400777 RepID=A0A3B0BNM3_9BACL|nr:DUF2612 domain-containing protein [Paenibacillus ginsengarvi]RKN74993.1 DUF2612 domain-containing protein [Paenibacillus ginsengarvi]